jgi:hypothetical protein
MPLTLPTCSLLNGWLLPAPPPFVLLLPLRLLLLLLLLLLALELSALRSCWWFACPSTKSTFSGTAASAWSSSSWKFSGRSLHQVGC